MHSFREPSLKNWQLKPIENDRSHEPGDCDLISIFVICNNIFTHETLKQSINRLGGYKIVGESVDKGDAFREIVELKPNVVVIESPCLSILDLTITEEIKVKLPETNILIISSSSDAQNIRPFLQAGAHGVCTIDASVEHMSLAIQTIAAGGAWVGCGTSTNVFKIKSADQDKVDKRSRLKQLSISQREVEILRLMAHGMSNREIAERLWLSVETIKSHSKNIMRKLEVSGRTQAVVAALRHGLSV